MRANSPDIIGKKVCTSLWGYVPSFDGEDVDKECGGDIIGTVESVAAYNPSILRIKVEQYKPNYGGGNFTADLSKIGDCLIGMPSHYEDGYLEEWFYNLEMVDENVPSVA